MMKLDHQMNNIPSGNYNIDCDVIPSNDVLSTQFETMEESLRDVLRQSGRHHDDSDVIARSPRRNHVETPLHHYPCRSSVRRTLSSDAPPSPSRYREAPVLRRTNSNSVENGDEYLLRHNGRYNEINYENIAMVDGYTSPEPTQQQVMNLEEFRLGFIHLKERVEKMESQNQHLIRLNEIQKLEYNKVACQVVHSERIQRKLQVECSKLRKQVETLADLNKQLRVTRNNNNNDETPSNHSRDEITITSSQPDVIPCERNEFIKEVPPSDPRTHLDDVTSHLDMIEEQTEMTSSGYATPSNICMEKVCTTCTTTPMTSSSAEDDMTLSLHSFNNASYHEVELKHYPKEQHAKIVSTTSSRMTSQSLVRGGNLRRSLNHNIGNHKTRDVTRPSSLVLDFNEERATPSPSVTPYEKVTLLANYENVHYRSSSNIHCDVTNHSLRHQYKTEDVFKKKALARSSSESRCDVIIPHNESTHFDTEKLSQVCQESESSDSRWQRTKSFSSAILYSPADLNQNYSSTPPLVTLNQSSSSDEEDVFPPPPPEHLLEEVMHQCSPIVYDDDDDETNTHIHYQDCVSAAVTSSASDMTSSPVFSLKKPLHGKQQQQYENITAARKQNTLERRYSEDSVNVKKTQLKEVSSKSRLCRHRSASTEGLLDTNQAGGISETPTGRSIRKHQPLKRTTTSQKSRLNKSFDAVAEKPSSGDQSSPAPATRGSFKKTTSGGGEKRSFVNLMKSKFTKSSSSSNLKTSQKKISNEKNHLTKLDIKPVIDSNNEMIPSDSVIGRKLSQSFVTSQSPESSVTPPHEENFLSDEGFAESSTIERDEKEEEKKEMISSKSNNNAVLTKQNQEFDDLIKFHQRQTCFEILPTNQLIRSHSRDLQSQSENKHAMKPVGHQPSNHIAEEVESNTYKKFRNKYNLQSDDSVAGVPQVAPKSGLKLRTPSKLLMGRSKKSESVTSGKLTTSNEQKRDFEKAYINSVVQSQLSQRFNTPDNQEMNAASSTSDITASVGTGSSFGSIKSSSENDQMAPSNGKVGRQSRLQLPTSTRIVAKQLETRCKSVDITLNDVTAHPRNEVTLSQRQIAPRNPRRSQSSDSRLTKSKLSRMPTESRHLVENVENQVSIESNPRVTPPQMKSKLTPKKSLRKTLSSNLTPPSNRLSNLTPPSSITPPTSSLTPPPSYTEAMHRKTPTKMLTKLPSSQNKKKVSPKPEINKQRKGSNKHTGLMKPRAIYTAS